MEMGLMESGKASDGTPPAKKAPSAMATALYVFALAVLAAVVAIVANVLFQEGNLLEGAQMDKLTHCVLGLVLGGYLVLRVALAISAFNQAKAAIARFYGAATAIAIASSHVSEALTISAGAEHEKKGIHTFRSELARLLKFSARCLSHSLKDEPIVKDGELMMTEEMLVINQSTKAPTPTLYVAKLVAKLIAQQREAGRLEPAICAEINSQIAVMASATYTIMSMKKMPIPQAVNEFACAWLFGFCLTVPVVISYYTWATPWVAPCASLFLVAFYFALNQVGAAVEDLTCVFSADVSTKGMEEQLGNDLDTFATGSAML